MASRKRHAAENQLRLAFATEGRGEAPTAGAEGLESSAASHETERPASVMQEVVEADNLRKALKRVRAIERAQQHVAAGHRWVVDVDLEKFFDRVNHDVLMSRVAQRTEDKPLLGLIRAFLNAGMMEGGLISPRTEGTPQGGPLSPLLSNLLLDDLDRELERREHRFVRYADDCNVYVASPRAGERVMQSITRFLEHRLKLSVNEVKSGVRRARDSVFLGFGLTPHREPKRRISPEAITRLKRRVRQITRRNRGISIEQVIRDLTEYLLGWRGYFGFCQTPSVLRDLDSWIRRKLRCVLWKQWKRSRTRYRQMRRLEIDGRIAAITAKAGRRNGPWHMSRTPGMSWAVSNAYLDSLGLPRLLTLSSS